jgi:hypothetical protein
MTRTTPLTRRAFLSLRADAARGTGDDVDPFASYAIACAQVNEARPFLADEARRHGIATDNRSDLDIVKEIFAKAQPPAE